MLPYHLIYGRMELSVDQLKGLYKRTLLSCVILRHRLFRHTFRRDNDECTYFSAELLTVESNGQAGILGDSSICQLRGFLQAAGILLTKTSKRSQVIQF